MRSLWAFSIVELRINLFLLFIQFFILLSVDDVIKLLSSLMLSPSIELLWAFLIFWIVFKLLSYNIIDLSSDIEIKFPDGNTDMAFIAFWCVFIVFIFWKTIIFFWYCYFQNLLSSFR
jgi:hypothetical protein